MVVPVPVCLLDVVVSTELASVVVFRRKVGFGFTVFPCRILDRARIPMISGESRGALSCSGETDSVRPRPVARLTQ